MINSGLAYSLIFGSFMGVIYMWLLWMTVQRFARGSGGIVLALLGFVLRLGVVGSTVFLTIKMFQLIGVIFYLAGFVIVKKIIQNKVKNYEYYSR